MKKILLLPFLVLIFACEKTENVVDFPKHDSKIAVNCYFNEGDSIRINVSKSLSVLDNKLISPINGAMIKVYENGNLLSPDIISLPSGDYIVKHKPVVGNNYSIEVAADKLDTVTASDYLPYLPLIAGHNFQVLDSHYINNQIDGHEIFYYGMLKGRVKLQITDRPGEENYYEIRAGFRSLLYNADSSTRTASGELSGLSCNDPSVLHVFSNAILLSDKFFDGTTHELIFNINDRDKWANYNYDLVPDSEIYITISSISKSAYLYKKTTGIYHQNMYDPFAEPVRIYGNIENGYGIFAGFNSREIRIQ